jgi:hypothetical protein
MRGRVVAVEGPSAAGKSRVVRDVAPRIAAAPLAEAYDRLTPTVPLTWRTPAELYRLEHRLLREEARRYREARELADVGGLVLADTAFLGPLTYPWALARLGVAPRSVVLRLVEEARALARHGRWGLPDGFVYLRTPVVERRRRAAHDPHGHPAALQERHQRVGEEELRFYRTVIAPSFGRRFRFVSGEGAPPRVAVRVRRAVRTLPTRPRGRPVVDRLLDALAAGATVP